MVAAPGLAKLAGTVIEYAGNAAAEYAISQMIRENSGCPGAILRELDRASFFSIPVHGRVRASYNLAYVRVYMCVCMNEYIEVRTYAYE